MWKWEYNVINLPHDYEIIDHKKICVGAKFGSCRYYGKGEITFLICYTASPEHVIKKSCDSMCGFPLP